LFVGNNRLVSLDGVDMLTRLEVLCAPNNRVASCDSVSRLPRLSELDLNANSIASLPKRFGNKLEQFYAVSNQISTIPDSLFDRCPSLRILTLHDNQISNIPNVSINAYYYYDYFNYFVVIIIYYRDACEF
jgi:Leucine-rich repeat (LRR) protein